MPIYEYVNFKDDNYTYYIISIHVILVSIILELKNSSTQLKKN
jgi:hypothetical protein